MSNREEGKSRGGAVGPSAAAASAAVSDPPRPDPVAGALLGAYVEGMAASTSGRRSAALRPREPMLARTAMVRPCSSTGTQLYRVECTTNAETSANEGSPPSPAAACACASSTAPGTRLPAPPRMMASTSTRTEYATRWCVTPLMMRVHSLKGECRNVLATSSGTHAYANRKEMGAGSRPATVDSEGSHSGHSKCTGVRNSSSSPGCMEARVSGSESGTSCDRRSMNSCSLRDEGGETGRGAEVAGG